MDVNPSRRYPKDRLESDGTLVVDGISSLDNNLSVSPYHIAAKTPIAPAAKAIAAPVHFACAAPAGAPPVYTLVVVVTRIFITTLSHADWYSNVPADVKSDIAGYNSA